MDFLNFISNVISSIITFFTENLWKVIVDWWALPAGERLGKLIAFFSGLIVLMELLKWIGQRIFKTRTRLEKKIEAQDAEIENDKAIIDRLEQAQKTLQ